MTPTVLARITHDTYRLAEANTATCILFRCEQDDLRDMDIVQLVADPDFQGLARGRLSVIRDKGWMPRQKLPLLRFDGTVFWAWVYTHRIESNDPDRQYETTFEYLYEYGN